MFGWSSSARILTSRSTLSSLRLSIVTAPPPSASAAACRLEMRIFFTAYSRPSSSFRTRKTEPNPPRPTGSSSRNSVVYREYRTRGTPSIPSSDDCEDPRGRAGFESVAAPGSDPSPCSGEGSVCDRATLVAGVLLVFVAAVDLVAWLGLFPASLAGGTSCDSGRLLLLPWFVLSARPFPELLPMAPRLKLLEKRVAVLFSNDDAAVVLIGTGGRASPSRDAPKSPLPLFVRPSLDCATVGSRLGVFSNFLFWRTYLSRAYIPADKTITAMEPTMVHVRYRPCSVRCDCRNGGNGPNPSVGSRPAWPPWNGKASKPPLSSRW